MNRPIYTDVHSQTAVTVCLTSKQTLQFAFVQKDISGYDTKHAWKKYFTKNTEM